MPYPTFLQFGYNYKAVADPQLRFFENFPGHDGEGNVGVSSLTISFHAVNIPLSLSYNYPAVLVQGFVSDGTVTVQHGLYSMSGGTLSLANSASASFNYLSSVRQWMTLITSATQNITPGEWYFGINISNTENQAVLYGNSSLGIPTAPVGFIYGRMTVSSAAMPGTVATSDLDRAGNDATRQPYVLISA